MQELEFIRYYIANSNQIMWFMGAGTSRTAGMPTAVDLIWDLKVKYYCLVENQDIKNHDVNNEQVRQRVQAYMDSKGFPNLCSPEEYSFYFELTFGNNYAAQQKYLTDKLNREKISLNIGHRVLAGLISLKRARLIFTTNFDEVVEMACAKVGEMTIPTFHLEGSYAATNALNTEQFPIYAKVHGDFKYMNVKNLPNDLCSNDKEIQNALIAASTRFGMIITGYSGRDVNVMSMFREAVNQHNAFPHGLYWTVPSLKNLEPQVGEFIKHAYAKGINAHIVETGTFDSMMSKIWRQVPESKEVLNNKVNTAKATEVKIPIGTAGRGFPVIRLNALQIISLPSKCALIKTKTEMSIQNIKEQLIKNKSRAVVSRTDAVIAWGETSEIRKGIGEENIETISAHDLSQPQKLISKSTLYHAFYERALAVGICDGRRIVLKNDSGFVLTFDPKDSSETLFQPLKNALIDRNGRPGLISGNVPNAPAGTVWTEAVRIKLQTRMGEVYLMLKPEMWIEPTLERRNYSEFIKNRKRTRYNAVAFKLLDAWITILLGTSGRGETVVTYQKGAEFPAEFMISTRTSYSRK